MTWLAARLELSVGLFLAACFLLPTGPAYALVFYAATLPCLAARLAIKSRVPRSERDTGGTPVGGPGGETPWPSLLSQAPARLRLDADPAVSLGAVLILWSLLTLLWGRDDGGRTAQFALGAAATLAFWTALHAAAAARAQLPNLLVALGTINALFGIARRFIAPPAQPHGDVLRLHGWGITYHPVLGAAVLAVCFLTALDSALRHRRAPSLLALPIIGAAVLLTASRGPEFAVVLAAGALVAARRPRLWPLLAAGAVPVAYVAWRTGLVRAGATGHVDIWRATWTEIVARPWFGHGLAADLPKTLGADKRFPHDLYLSLLFYSGTVGFLLFVAWAGLLARRVLRAWREPETPWIAALCLNALLAGLTDFGQITKGPGPLWLILWLPAALAASLPPAPATRTASAPAPARASPLIS